MTGPALMGEIQGHVARVMAERAEVLEAACVDAVRLQRYDMLERLQIVAYPDGSESVASMLE